jgi:DNA-binding beta-propeller fold protein YncE
MPADVYGTPDDKFILVGLTGSDSVEVFDVSGKDPSVRKVIKTGEAPMPSAPLATSAMCYVSNRVANTISKIDLQTMEVVDSYRRARRPGLHRRHEPDGKLIMVTSRWARKLTMIDTEPARGRAPGQCRKIALMVSGRWTTCPTLSGPCGGLGPRRRPGGG